MDLTNHFDIENGINDSDIVINCIGEKSLVKSDEDYEEPNIIVPREIAKVCARLKREGKVKRLIHFSAAGASPDAVSRRLRTKWQGEQEVLKYFPEATIVRPTTIITNGNANNFINYYNHCWNSNNGTVFLVDEGKALRQPIIDHDVAIAIMNIISLEESRGQIYELGGSHAYSLKELLEYLSNALNHRPKYISYSYEDFMKLYIGPNFNFEKALHYLAARPDFSAEMRIDITVNNKDGVKTMEDLHLKPVSMHQILYDVGQWGLYRLTTERNIMRDWDEYDADDEAQH